MEYLKQELAELSVQQKIELAIYLLTEVSTLLFASDCSSLEDDDEILEFEDD